MEEGEYMAKMELKKLVADRIKAEKKSKKSFLSLKADESQINSQDMIDLSSGQPDSMADPDVVASLAFEAGQWENRDYAGDDILDFQEAANHYLETVFQVKSLKIEKEITHTFGVKSALALIAQALINPGDVVLMPTPGYSALEQVTKRLEGEVYSLPLNEKNQFLPDFDTIPEEILKKSKLLYLNYPHNPTGAVATKAFFKRVVKFAKENQIIVVHDAAYGAITYQPNQPLSFLTIPGAKQVGIEIHSFSEAFNMSGWRLGFLAGNANLVEAFCQVKKASDVGQFKAIQKAGIVALKKPEITELTVAKYERRLSQLVQLFQEVGFQTEMPKGTFYLYMKAPKAIENGIQFKKAIDFAKYLLSEKQIVVKPYDEEEAYIRISATFHALESEEEAIYNQIRNRLAGISFVF